MKDPVDAQVVIRFRLDRVVAPGGPVGLVLGRAEPGILLILYRVVTRDSPIGLVLGGTEPVLRLLFQDLVAGGLRRLATDLLEPSQEIEVDPGGIVL